MLEDCDVRLSRLSGQVFGGDVVRVWLRRGDWGIHGRIQPLLIGRWTDAGNSEPTVRHLSLEYCISMCYGVDPGSEGSKMVGGEDS
jgi:hypothetical protein